MIKSEFLLDIFDIAFDDVENAEKLRLQIPFLNESDREHTGTGLFIHFITENGIEKYRIPTENCENWNINGEAIERINGIELRNSELNILADVDIHITNGIVNSIEIWNKIGEDYPKFDPTKYELRQIWLGSKNRSTVRNL